VRHKKEASGKIAITHTIIDQNKCNLHKTKTSLVKINNVFKKGPYKNFGSIVDVIITTSLIFIIHSCFS